MVISLSSFKALDLLLRSFYVKDEGTQWQHFAGTGSENKLIEPLFLKVVNTLVGHLPMLILRLKQFLPNISAPFLLVPVFIIWYLYDLKGNYKDKMV